MTEALCSKEHHHQFKAVFELLGKGSGCRRSSPESGYSSSPLFLAVSAPKGDKVTCSSAGTLTLDLFCSPHLEDPRLCHLALKGCMSSSDITSPPRLLEEVGTDMRYMTEHRYCLIGFELEPVSISFSSWVEQILLRVALYFAFMTRSRCMYLKCTWLLL